MIKFLIVDDEEEIRTGIAGNTDWESYGVTVCGLAGDADEAMELCIRQEPDIILLDISMPGKSGLEVARWLCQSAHPAKMIILSGHDDFQYAQQAIHCGVSEYLLKPCSSSEILKTVLALKKTIEYEHREQEDRSRQRALFESNLPSLKEWFLLDLMLRKSSERERIKQYFDLYQIHLTPDDFRVIVLIAGGAQGKGYALLEESPHVKQAVRAVADAVIGKQLYELFEYTGNIILLMNCRGQSDSALAQRLEMMQTRAMEELKVPVSVGYSTCHGHPEKLFDAYLEAVQAAENNRLSGTPAVMRAGKPEQQQLSAYTDDEERLMASIASGDQAAADEAADSLIRRLKDTAQDEESAQAICAALINRLTHTAQSEGIPSASLFDKSTYLPDPAAGQDPLGLFHSRIQQIARRIIQTRKNGLPNNQIITLAVRFIHHNYASNISLASVAREVYITPKYLSTLFKQSLGRNFTDYLNSIRIQKACELLQNTRTPVYDIAHEVGYQSEKYFSRTFKCRLSVTPGQFRNINTR